MKKIFLSIFLMSILSLFGCNQIDHSRKSVFDLAKKFEKVYILEGDRYVPFIVMQNGYDTDKTLLLRERVLPQADSMDEKASYYENCYIDRFLNGDYLKLLGNTPVCDTTIRIATQEAIGTSGEESIAIKRKVFLLSAKEVGINAEVNIANEGDLLKYFASDKNRIVYRDDNTDTIGWWLRSANTYYSSVYWGIGADGRIGIGNAYDCSGIRPAFCVPADTIVCKKSNIMPDDVYVLCTDNQE